MKRGGNNSANTLIHVATGERSGRQLWA